MLRAFGDDTTSNEGERELRSSPDEANIEGQLKSSHANPGL